MMKHHAVCLPFLILFMLVSCRKQETVDLPNILWITSEDNDRFLGCYGDSFATTPNLDRLAEEGFLYTHAYANASVCAPARNTIITGVLACSAGNEEMRSRYPKSDRVHYYTEYLKKQGYYCTNNSKTDYNLADPPLDDIWDECGRTAHYKNRSEGQPFFAIFNCTISHESSIHRSIPAEKLRHKPENVNLPPYHPDTKEFRHDWAQYYDKVEDMDAWAGTLLDELDSLGLAENTIVFYYSDHAGILGRSKRFLFETGTHVPFIVRIPEKYSDLYPDGKPGSRIDRLISFVDLAPTLLSLAGIPAPDYMQGHAFLGRYTGNEPQYVYMFRDRMDECYDLSRSIVNKHYRYTRNYNPYRIYLQHLEYLWRAPSMRSWEEAYKEGRCNKDQARYWKPKPSEELYDIREDRWEVNNLAGDSAHRDELTMMRYAYDSLSRSLWDAGFIPEAERTQEAGDQSIYDFIRSPKVPFSAIMDAAWLASSADPGNLSRLQNLLKDEDPAVRYWATQGLLILGDRAEKAVGDLKQAAADPSPDVCVVAAEALYGLGEKQAARDTYVRVLETGIDMARTRALNSIDNVGDNSPVIMDATANMLKQMDTIQPGAYDVRAANRLFEKWQADPEDFGVTFPQ